MTTPFDGASFIFLWVGFLLLMSSGVVIFFVWAIRTKQFSDQDHARYLPLQARIPLRDETKDAPAAEHGRRQP